MSKQLRAKRLSLRQRRSLRLEAKFIPYYFALTFYHVPWGNRTLNCPLGVRASGVNSSQGLFISIKESLAFSNFPVILCQDKLIEIILCKTLRVSKLLDLLTNRQSHSVPRNSLIWLPFTLWCVVMIAHYFY